MLPQHGLVGQVVEQRYRIEELLGRGAMGTVFRARHVKVGREFAIKVLHEHLVRDPDMVARFEREAALVARLSHRNLINVIDVGETAAHQRLMVLELARGECLASIVERGPLAGERVINLVRQLLCGLEYAHDAGLVHRDLKPENVIVERDYDGAEVPRIVDFGIAVLREPARAGAPPQRITDASVVLGTPAYMAPEQAQGGDPDPRTDLFALGVMMYEMLAGTLPFDGTGVDVAMANLSRLPPSIRRRAPSVEVDPLLEAFARQLMSRALDERFASARAALDVLALIERDRDAAAAELGIVDELELRDTAPIRVPVRPAAVTERLPVCSEPPLDGSLALLVPPPVPLVATLRWCAVGCAALLGGAALALVLAG